MYFAKLCLLNVLRWQELSILKRLLKRYKMPSNILQRHLVLIFRSILIYLCHYPTEEYILKLSVITAAVITSININIVLLIAAVLI